MIFGERAKSSVPQDVVADIIGSFLVRRNSLVRAPRIHLPYHCDQKQTQASILHHLLLFRPDVRK